MSRKPKNPISFFMVNKIVLAELGPCAAIILADLTSKEAYFKEAGRLTSDGMFYNAHSNIEHDTGFGRKAQTRAFALMKKHRLIEITPLTGNANKFKIRHDNIEVFLLDHAVPREHGDRVRAEQGGMYATNRLPCSNRTPNNNTIRTQNKIPARCASLELESSSSSAPSLTGLKVMADRSMAEVKEKLPSSAEPQVGSAAPALTLNTQSVVPPSNAPRASAIHRLGYDPTTLYKSFRDWFVAHPHDADAQLWLELNSPAC